MKTIVISALLLLYLPGCGKIENPDRGSGFPGTYQSAPAGSPATDVTDSVRAPADMVRPAPRREPVVRWM